MRKRSKSIIAILTLPLGITPALAQTNGSLEPAELERIVVEGDATVVTEGSDSYDADYATVGGKQPLTLREIPQTVNVITRARLDDANANSLEEAAYLLPNLTEASGNGFLGSVYSRGYEVFTYNIDGAPRPFLSLYGTAPDLAFFDRVEILSGPSGVFQGTGEPVGTVNLVRKRAKADFHANIAATVGSFDSRRLEADLGGAITESGSVSGRIVGFTLDEETYLDFAQRERDGFYGTLEFRPTAQSALYIGGIVESQLANSHSGLPTFSDGQLLDVDMDTYIGAPWNANDQDTDELFVEYEHYFSNGAVLRALGRTYDREAEIRNALAASPVDPVTGDFSMFTFARDFEETSDYWDINYTAPFEMGSGDSEFTVGADLRETDQGFVQNFDFGFPMQNIATFDPTSLIEPQISFPGVGPGFRLNTTTETEEFGVYGYARLAPLEGVRVTVGGRYTSYDSTSRDLGRARVTADIDEDEFVPLVGASWDVTDTTTLYASYSEIFQPQNGNLATGARIAPLEGRQWEIGVKSDWLNNRLAFQAAIFSVEDENRAISDPDNPGAVIAAGEANNEGFETTIAGRINDRFSITAGYAYVDTDLETAPTPEHTFTVWGRYDAGNQFYAGAGARAVSDFDSFDGPIRIEASGYGIFDAMLGYRVTDHWEAQLFIKNLFDKEYVNRVNDTTRGVFYGEPLSGQVRVSYRF